MSMLMYIILVFIAPTLRATNGQSANICPNNCQCFLDQKGRNVVECREGGMKGPIQFVNLSADIEILKISAPEDNTNDLSMNPAIGKFRKLEEIHIIKSNIPNLGEHFFYQLSKLEVLNLGQNNITQTLPMNFFGLARVKELCLDDNRISSLPSETFRYLVELRTLSVQRNRIQQMATGVFRGLARLRVLRLNGNLIRAFKADVFKDLKELRSLECRGCHLKTIDKHVNELLPLLSHLDLSENEIRLLDASDFANMTNLRVLKLESNQIQEIPTAVLATNQDMRRILLAKNQIMKIAEDAFVNLENLTEIDVGYNKLRNVERETFLEIGATLERLVLSGNKIPVSQLRYAMEECSSLKDLQLADCSMPEINEPFIPESVGVLNLANNQLSYLSALVLPVALKELDLSRNLFRGLDEDVAERVEHLRCKLDHNPWSCDLCHIIPMLERVNRSAVMYNVRCALPYHHVNKILGTVQREELSWCNADGYSSEGINFFLSREDGRLGIIAAGASLMLLILTSIAVLAALCYSKRHAANYYTHEEKRDEKEAIFENQTPLFGEELSFKFPLEINDTKIQIATIADMKKEHGLLDNNPNS